MKPTKSLHPNPDWRYSKQTNLAATFRRVRREQAEAAAKTNVQPINRKKESKNV